MKKKYRLLKDDSLWYKDAVIYELHIKAFQDSNGDGVGDIKGLIKRLDYLKELGVNAIWLLPFYPSPFKDDGYDIADYYNIHPDYGTLQDFKELLDQAHKRGMRIITELVLNHTSDQHPWFQKSRKAKKGSKWRDFYVWSKTPEKYGDARIIFSDFETSNWTWDAVAGEYYWHRFYSHQPDLNYDNPKVQKEMFSVIDYWLGMGVDGLRLDAVPYLVEREGTNCENLPETHDILKRLRAHVDSKYENKLLLAEANQWIDDAVEYFGSGDECHMAFNFPLMPRIFMSVYMEDRFPITDILDTDVEIPESCQWAMFLRNHDELTLEMVTDEERDYMYKIYATDSRAKINLGIRRRLAPLLNNNRRRIELVNTLLFSLPGTPMIYYGDEIGMGDNFYLGDRDGVRTPMQWTPDRNAGFSVANPQKLYLPIIIDPEYRYEAVNVETQEKNLSSLLWWMKRVIAMRKKYKAFGRGSLKFIDSQNHKVLSFMREYDGEAILVVVNLSRFSQVAELGMGDYDGMIPIEIFSNNHFPMIKNEPYVLTLGPNNYFWFRLEKEKKQLRVKRPFPHYELGALSSIEDVLDPPYREIFEADILPDFLRQCRWFGGKGKVIRNIAIVDEAVFEENMLKGYMLFLRVDYYEGLPELYLLPVIFIFGQKAQIVRQNSPRSIVTSLTIKGRQALLVDATNVEEFQFLLRKLINSRHKLKSLQGAVSGISSKFLREEIKSSGLSDEAKLSLADQSNTSIVFGDRMILKLFRKIESGINPDVEISQALSEKTSFKNTPKFYGALHYTRRNKKEINVGLMQEFVKNEGDGWAYVLQALDSLYDHVLAHKDRVRALEQMDSIIPDRDKLEIYKDHEELIGVLFLQMMKKLGQRTGEMHGALSSLTTKDFQPESFSLLYQKALYQSMKTSMKQVFSTLEKNLKHMPKGVSELAEKVLSSRLKLMSMQRKITRKKLNAKKVRIHGDYHLGQVLYTGKDFYVIDFEGEPLRSISERRLKRSPLRDVAGMVRSFHYAANAVLKNKAGVRARDKNFISAYSKQWYLYVSSVFLSTYLENVPRENTLSAKAEDFSNLFDSFLIDKAVYELGYELNNRPEWVEIPLKGILYVLEGTSIEG